MNGRDTRKNIKIYGKFNFKFELIINIGIAFIINHE